MGSENNPKVIHSLKNKTPYPGEVPAERFFRKLPALAITGDEQSVDRIAYELLNLLTESAGADIGQLSLLPRGGRVEKVCIVKDGRPWMREDMALHPYNPGKGFTSWVISTGKTLVIEDIWAPPSGDTANPFLEIHRFMDRRYLDEIKRPVASTLILPIKRDQEIFCTIELSRYRQRPGFTTDDQRPLDEFAAQYGSLIINYILDTKNRIALNTAHDKLINISRLIASDGRIDYIDAVNAYRTLSAADLGFAFFRRGAGYGRHPLYLVVWKADEIKEIYFPDFKLSSDSILCDGSNISYPMEGNGSSRRLKRFQGRIADYPGIRDDRRQFLLRVIDRIRSYVVYPLHMLNQDLGAIHLASSRNDFCTFLHMSPFLSLYNALLKSFLLNERVAAMLSQVSLKIHNPGFYCLGGLKSALIQENPELLAIPTVSNALDCLDNLLTELHEKGKMLACRQRHIHLQKWLGAWINQKRSQHPGVAFHLELDGSLPTSAHVRAGYEQLETLFENLLVNSLRAIGERRSREHTANGTIRLSLSGEKDGVSICFGDNGLPYKTISGRGTPQMQSIMTALGGGFKRLHHPYRVVMTFPFTIIEDKEVHSED